MEEKTPQIDSTEISLEYLNNGYILLKEAPSFSSIYERVARVVEGNLNSPTKENGSYVHFRNIKGVFKIPERGIEKSLTKEEAEGILNDAAQSDFKGVESPDLEKMALAEKAIDFMRFSEKEEKQ